MNRSGLKTVTKTSEVTAVAQKAKRRMSDVAKCVYQLMVRFIHDSHVGEVGN